MKPPSQPPGRLNRRGFITASVCVGATAALWGVVGRDDEVVVALVADPQALTLSLSHARAVPGQTIEVHAEWPDAPRDADLCVALVRGREAQPCRDRQAIVTLVEVPLRGGAGQVKVKVPLVEGDEIDLENEAVSLTAAVFVADQEEALRVSDAPLDVILSPFFLGS